MNPELAPRTRLILSSCLLMFLAAPSVGAETEPISDVGSLSGRNSKPRTLAEISAGKPLVLGFVDAQAPRNDPAFSAMNEIESAFRSSNTGFAAVYSESMMNLPQSVAHANDVELSWCFLHDLDGQLAASLDVTGVGTFLLLDEQLRIVYRGDLGTPARQQGQSTVPATGLWLALDQLLRGEVVEPAEGKLNGRLFAKAGELGSRYRNFAEHASPILRRRCQQCHSKEGSAPFPLVVYRDVAAKADAIERAIITNRMPPWRADERFGKFSNNCRLTPPEKAILLEWLRSGREPGDLSQWARSYTPPERETLEQPDAVIQLPPGTAPLPGEADYTYFVFPEAETQKVFAQDRWLTAINCHAEPAGDVKLLRIAVFPPGVEPSEENLGRALGVFPRGIPPTTWSFPAGMALRIPAGSRLLAQVYCREESDPKNLQPKIAFRFAPALPEKEISTIVLAPKDLLLTPMNPDTSAQSSLYCQEDLEVVGAVVQMNRRGKHLLVDYQDEDEADETTLFSVSRQDFRWQSAFVFETPVPIAKRSILRIAASWDNSRLNFNNDDPSRAISLGFPAHQETAACWLYVAHRPKSDPLQAVVVDPEQIRLDARKLVIKEAADNWKISGEFANASDWSAVEDPARPRYRLTLPEEAKAETWRLQLTSPPFPVEKGKRYLVRMRAQADRPRTIECLLGQNEPPRKLLSLRNSVALEGDLADYLIELTASADDPSASVNFYAGNDSAGVEIESLSVEEQDAGEPLPIKVLGSRPGAIIARTLSNNTDAYRVEMSADSGDKPFQAKIVSQELEVAKGETFRVTFRARADHMRRMIVTVSEEKPPCQNLGCFQNVVLHRRWTKFDFDVTAKEGGLGTIMLFVGGDPTAIEITDMKLSKEPDAKDKTVNRR